MSQLFEKNLSYKIMEMCFRVHNNLGPGLLQFNTGVKSISGGTGS